MKKSCSIILAILLFTVVTASAEYSAAITGTLDKFEIRNGIQFFMSKDEVIQREELEIDDSKYSTNDNHLDISGSLAGLSNANGEYIFNTDWKLVSLEYHFGKGSILYQKTREEMLSDYDYIEKALSEKYGSPVGGISAFVSDYFQNYMDFLSQQKNAQVLKLSERVLKLKSGGYVKIEHWAAVNSLQEIEYEFTSHYVQYSYMTDEYVDFITDAVNANESQRDNDL
jgi:hypothetical protein